MILGIGSDLGNIQHTRRVSAKRLFAAAAMTLAAISCRADDAGVGNSVVSLEDLTFYQVRLGDPAFAPCPLHYRERMVACRRLAERPPLPRLQAGSVYRIGMPETESGCGSDICMADEGEMYVFDGRAQFHEVLRTTRILAIGRYDGARVVISFSEPRVVPDALPRTEFNIFIEEQASLGEIDGIMKALVSSEPS